jgi:hypothetical protein
LAATPATALAARPEDLLTLTTATLGSRSESSLPISGSRNSHTTNATIAIVTIQPIGSADFLRRGSLADGPRSILSWFRSTGGDGTRAE